ncbi:MAG: chorismate synthase [Deltaproteobacteria bacterium]|nr:chorismate synthase [Deltaproteobacteria bacterium]
MPHLRWTTAGESHGPELHVWMDGIPSGLPLLAEHVDEPLARRQRGYGRGGRMKIESDRVRFAAGVRGGETLGSPIAMVITNRDHASWLDRMPAGPFPSPPERVTRPRPGHADLAGGQKHDRHDLRDILERASARETAARVAAGAVAARLVGDLGVRVGARVVAIGGIADERAAPVDAVAWEEELGRARDTDLRTVDATLEARWREAIHAASHAGDTLGGVVEAVAIGAPPGLGSHVHWDRKLDGRLAQAVMSVQAIKGVEIGLGFEGAHRPGSRVHDPIGYDAGARTFTRASNGAGGLEGGVTNGAPIVVRAAMKPISTLRAALSTVDVVTKETHEAAVERSDICAVAAASYVVEAMVALVLADAMLEKLGGDSMREVRRNLDGYRAQLAEY